MSNTEQNNWINLGFNLPELNINVKGSSKPIWEKTEQTSEQIKETLTSQEQSKFKDESLNQGINVIFNWGADKEEIKKVISKLEPTHSLREFFEILENQVKWEIYILADKRQITQAQEDINFILSWKKAVYIEYNPVDNKPNLVKISNISGQKMDELYESVLKPLLKIW